MHLCFAHFVAKRRSPQIGDDTREVNVERIVSTTGQGLQHQRCQLLRLFLSIIHGLCAINVTVYIEVGIKYKRK